MLKKFILINLILVLSLSAESYVTYNEHGNNYYNNCSNFTLTTNPGSAASFTAPCDGYITNNTPDGITATTVRRNGVESVVYSCNQIARDSHMGRVNFPFSARSCVSIPQYSAMGFVCDIETNSVIATQTTLRPNCSDLNNVKIEINKGDIITLFRSSRANRFGNPTVNFVAGSYNYQNQYNYNNNNYYYNSYFNPNQTTSLTSPSNRDYYNSRQIDFRWNAVQYALRYELLIVNTNTQQEILRQEVNNLYYSLYNRLNYGNYSYRVRAIGRGLNGQITRSNWSPLRYFHIGNNSYYNHNNNYYYNHNNNYNNYYTNLSAPTGLQPEYLVENTRFSTLSWTPVNGATSYDVIMSVGENASIQYPLISTTVHGTTYKVTKSLTFGDYTFRVRARNGNHTSSWSEPQVFWLYANMPNITSPTSGATIHGVRPTISWAPVSGVTSYEIWISEASTPATAIYKAFVHNGKTTYQTTKDLKANSDYAVWVRATDNGSAKASKWSHRRNFRTSNQGYYNNYQCQDGLDNDHDGAIDANDTDCQDAYGNYNPYGTYENSNYNNSGGNNSVCIFGNGHASAHCGCVEYEKYRSNPELFLNDKTNTEAGRQARDLVNKYKLRKNNSFSVSWRLLGYFWYYSDLFKDWFYLKPIEGTLWRWNSKAWQNGANGEHADTFIAQIGGGADGCGVCGGVNSCQ